MKFIETQAELRTHYRQPGELPVRKEMRRLDAHSRNFLAKSPFVLIGSQDGAGNADVTPKGDRPGFVAVLDDVTIAIPDRPGNNRLDTWENVVANPAVGLIFLIPGMDETLRINGEARLTADEGLRGQLMADGKVPVTVLVVKIRAVYMHCAKAFMRSQLWQPESWPARTEMPTLGEIMRDQMALAKTGGELDEELADAYRKSMW
jgi:PPOX class probable FMN-dependent enzyme